MAKIMVDTEEMWNLLDKIRGTYPEKKDIMVAMDKFEDLIKVAEHLGRVLSDTSKYEFSKEA